MSSFIPTAITEPFFELVTSYFARKFKLTLRNIFANNILQTKIKFYSFFTKNFKIENVQLLINWSLELDTVPLSCFFVCEGECKTMADL